MILATVDKHLVIHSNDYEFQKSKSDFFEDKKYYHQKNMYIPEIIVVQNGNCFTAIKREINLEIANKIDEIKQIDITVRGDFDISRFDKSIRETIILRSLKELAANDLKQTIVSKWEVISFFNTLSDKEVSYVMQLINKYAEHEDISIETDSIKYDNERQLIEYFVSTPKYSRVLNKRYVNFLTALKDKRIVIKAINGVEANKYLNLVSGKIST